MSWRDDPAMGRAGLRRLAAFFVVGLSAEVAIHLLLRWRSGGPSLPLDDAFIHFQYARSIADGHPFRYSSPLDAPTSGATSILYVLALAAAWAAGAHGDYLIIVAQLLGGVGWALTAEGMYQLGTRLGGKSVARGGAALVFACGPLAWMAGSGMETIFAAACVTWTFALAFACADSDAPPSEPRTAIVALAILGSAAPFVRPELASLSAIAAVVIAARARGRRRGLALLPVAGTLALPLFWKLVTGSFLSTGALVKWTLYNVSYDAVGVVRHLAQAFAGIWLVLLNGVWPLGVGVPWGAHVLTAGGFIVAHRSQLVRQRRLGALLVIAAFVLLLVPGTAGVWYAHRGRYIWPFLCVPLLFAVLLAARLGDFVERRLRRDRAPRVGAALAIGGLLLLFGSRLPNALGDLATCASEIRGQQVTMAQQHIARLPAQAIVLVNDVGAVAYYGRHRTVDYIGLTSAAFAGDHGPGRVFETLEAMPVDSRPTHAALFREWFEADVLLGPTLARVTVTPTMVPYASMDLAAVRTELFGSAARPFSPVASDEELADELDVALLPDEAAHRYRVDSGHPPANTILLGADGPTGAAVVDGGRSVARGETFVVRGSAGRPGRLLARTLAEGSPLRVLWNGAPMTSSIGAPSPPVAKAAFREAAFAVTAAQALAENRVEVQAQTANGSAAGYQSFHYFYIQRVSK